MKESQRREKFLRHPGDVNEIADGKGDRPRIGDKDRFGKNYSKIERRKK